jgi:hypothetical protein
MHPDPAFNRVGEQRTGWQSPRSETGQAADRRSPPLGIRLVLYCRASTEAYFLIGVKGWKFDQATFRLTPVLLDGSDGPVAELREMCERFSARNGD